MTEVKKEGVLSLVLPENTKVSGKSINIEETVSHRSLEKGTMDSYVGTDWYQKVLFYQYLVNYLGNYVEKKQDRVLEYELEYVLGGKRNDADNLKIVVSELLAMREPLNMASLTASSQRQSEAMALAVTLAGVSANPAVIEAVKYGILVAWAFAESVLDVRTLLSGGKITTANAENSEDAFGGAEERVSEEISSEDDPEVLLTELIPEEAGDSMEEENAEAMSASAPELTVTPTADPELTVTPTPVPKINVKWTGEKWVSRSSVNVTLKVDANGACYYKAVARKKDGTSDVPRVDTGNSRVAVTANRSFVIYLKNLDTEKEFDLYLKVLGSDGRTSNLKKLKLNYRGTRPKYDVTPTPAYTPYIPDVKDSFVRGLDSPLKFTQTIRN